MKTRTLLVSSLMLITLTLILGRLSRPTSFAAALGSRDMHPASAPQATPSVFAFDALAIGVPNEAIGNISYAGGINVIYGSNTGLRAAGNQGWDQNRPGVLDEAETDDRFGYALASGDFNGDGYPDLAVGVPGESVNGGQEQGAVQVFYGSFDGFAGSNELWHQDRPGVAGGAEYLDAFGAALASGDFNRDGYDDLAIGIPGEDVGNIINAGAVQVLYGSSRGLTAAGNQLWDQDTPDVLGQAESSDSFGEVLATGDFNGDGYDDLAIGVPFEDVGNIANAGAVQILYGSAQKLTAAHNQLLDQNSADLIDDAEQGDMFGTALAAGDFDGDGYADLAVGVPFESGEGPAPIAEMGMVQVIYGSSSGLSTRDQVWDQSKGTMQDNPEPFDWFGFAVAAGDFNRDGYDDLAVGVPQEDVGNKINAGAVQILYGSTAGLTDAGNQLWTEDDPSLPNDGAEAGDKFGSTLVAGDFDANGYADLAVGAPFEGVSSSKEAGAVQVIYGSAQGLTASNSQWWHQDTPNIEGMVEEGDRFGAALAVIPRITCPYDPFEPNSTTSPYDASDDFRYYGGLQIVNNAFICPPGDEDVFAFPVQAGQTIVVDLTSLPADYNLALGDPTDKVVAWGSNPGTQDEHIEYTATVSGRYLLIVAGSSANVWNNKDGYSLRVVLQGQDCQDAYEPNDHFNNAIAISTGANIQAYICNANDRDYFKFPVTAGQTISVDLTDIPTGTDYDLWLIDPNGNDVASSRNSNQADEHISHTAAVGGDYRVLVKSYSGYDAAHPYSLRVDVSGSQKRHRIYVPAMQNKK